MYVHKFLHFHPLFFTLCTHSNAIVFAESIIMNWRLKKPSLSDLLRIQDKFTTLSEIIVSFIILIRLKLFWGLL